MFSHIYTSITLSNMLLAPTYLTIPFYDLMLQAIRFSSCILFFSSRINLTFLFLSTKFIGTENSLTKNKKNINLRKNRTCTCIKCDRAGETNWTQLLIRNPHENYENVLATQQWQKQQNKNQILWKRHFFPRIIVSTEIEMDSIKFF